MFRIDCLVADFLACVYGKTYCFLTGKELLSVGEETTLIIFAPEDTFWGVFKERRELRKAFNYKFKGDD